MSAETATPANVATSTSDAILRAAHRGRKALTIWNDSAVALYVNFGAAASATACVVKIAADGYYELPQPVYVGEIHGVLASSTGAARVTEIT